MIKVLAAALALAVAAAPGVALAKSHKRVKTTVAVAATLGTANLFVFGPLKHGKWHWSTKIGTTYAVGAIACVALSPIITVALEQRQLSNEEVIWSTVTCFFPPLALVPLLAAK
jgi:ABC-type proline/glycine betaine transport system permease subunit